MMPRLPILFALIFCSACGKSEAPPAAPTVHFGDFSAQPYLAAAEVTFTTQEQVQPGLEVVSPAGKVLQRVESSVLGTQHSLLLPGLATGELYSVRPIGTRLNGVLARGALHEIQTLPPTSGQGDEFAAANIDLRRWQLQDVHGFGQARHVTAGDERILELRVPGSLPYQNWTTGDQSLALLENVIDEDLDLEFRSLASNGPDFTGHGLLIEEGAGTWLRFEFVSTGGRSHIFVAGFRDGQSVVQEVQALPIEVHDDNLDLWMRVTRVQDSWTQEWSLDGITFQSGAEFEFPLMVRRMGPGISHSGGHASPFTARFDWLRTGPRQSDTDPDLSAPEDIVAPWCKRAEAWAVSSDSVALRFETDEEVLAQVEVGSDLSSFQSLGNQTLDEDGFLFLSGLQAASTLHFRAQLVDSTGHVTWSPPLTVTTPQNQTPSTPYLSFWEGQEEAPGIWTVASGALGSPQSTWNLRGSLENEGSPLAFVGAEMFARLDGGPWITLGVGDHPLDNYLPKRLASLGDFNAAIHVNALEDGVPLEGQIGHLVDLQATLASGEVLRAMVRLEHTPGVTWQLPVSLDFTGTQVPHVGLVDGRWEQGPHETLVGALCTDSTALGYQRMITLGEGHGPDAWKDYLVELTLVVDGFDENITPEAVPFLGLGARWRGHSHVGSLEQPAENPHPMGGLFALHWVGEIPHWDLTTEETQPVVEWSNGPAMPMGVPMKVKLQCQSQPDNSCIYSLKVWAQEAEEPEEWDLVHGTTDKGQRSGAFVLIANHISLALKEITVNEL